MSSYKVVVSKSLNEFQARCTDLLNQGYSPVGGFVAENREYLQAFILISTEEPTAFKKPAGRPPKVQKEDSSLSTLVEGYPR